jgi:NADH:ubiquinone oxidoreductase subunit E
MPVQLTICRLCVRSRPDIFQTVTQLAAAFPDELIVVELECMAACDDVPAVMVETDYFPRISPCQLDDVVRQTLAQLETS